MFDMFIVTKTWRGKARVFCARTLRGPNSHAPRQGLAAEGRALNDNVPWSELKLLCLPTRSLVVKQKEQTKSYIVSALSHPPQKGSPPQCDASICERHSRQLNCQCDASAT